MAVTSDKAAPYATASSVMDLIARHRDRGLPSPVTGEVLGRAGIPDSLIPRTLQSLQTLDLIDDKGAPTATLQGLRLAPEAEFKQRLAEWLNSAYADVLNFINPATADETAVRDAFRTYNPVGQQPRMVSLFTGLYAAAGIGPDKSAQPRVKQAQTTVRPRSTTPPRGWERILQGAKAAKAAKQEPSAIPEPLTGLLSRLPNEGDGWTKAKRDAFINTFGAVLDFCFPIIEKAELVAGEMAWREDHRRISNGD